MNHVKNLRVTRTHKDTVLESRNKAEVMKALNLLKETPAELLMHVASRAVNPDVALKALRMLAQQEHNPKDPQHLLNKLTTLELTLYSVGSQRHLKVRMGVDKLIHKCIELRDKQRSQFPY